MRRSSFSKKSKKKKWPKKVPKRTLPKKKKNPLFDGLKLTKEFTKAFEILEEVNDHIFLTGQAGTGKSTLLAYFREETKKKHVVLAPTGVAALNVRGQTIHSFFGFHPDITPDRVKRAPADKREAFEHLETIVIDEISMVRADLLDCVDRALRMNRGVKEPFGGVQMIFVGDLFQLPPVVTREEQGRFKTEYPSPYFFSADVMREAGLKKMQLSRVHRQKNTEFVQLLNRVREGAVTADDVEIWNQRHDPYIELDTNEFIVHLTTTNKAAKQRNDMELARLDGKEWVLDARSAGDLGTRRMPSASSLRVKEGARIMFTTNDPMKRWVNGSLGTIAKIKKDGLSKTPVLHVDLEDGTRVEVQRHTWEVFAYEFDGSEFHEEVVGRYEQYPIAHAWAVTIHKAQGKTFDKVLVDVGWGTFAHGQMYVALSRCTSFDGVTLLKPFRQKDVIVDERIKMFLHR